MTTREIKPINCTLRNPTFRFQCGVIEDKTVQPETVYPDGRIVQHPAVVVSTFHLFGWGETPGRAAVMARLNGCPTTASSPPASP